MPDYEKMYYALFNKITDVIETLQELQRQAEEMYIESAAEGKQAAINNE